MEAYETIDVSDEIKIKIFHDDDPGDTPRDWCNFGTLACWHRRYNLGDIQPKEDYNEFMERLAFDADPELEEIKERVDRIWDHFYPGYDKPERLATKIADQYLKQRTEQAIDENYVIENLYLYDHSGLTMNTGGFSCPWDSGQVGIIYAKKQDVIREFGDWSAESIAKTRRLLIAEVETYSQYLEGDIWGYEIVKVDEGGDEEFLDSCWNFYGLDYCREQAQEAAEHFAKSEEKSFLNYL